MQKPVQKSEVLQIFFKMFSGNKYLDILKVS